MSPSFDDNGVLDALVGHLSSGSACSLLYTSRACRRAVLHLFERKFLVHRMDNYRCGIWATVVQRCSVLPLAQGGGSEITPAGWSYALGLSTALRMSDFETLVVDHFELLHPANLGDLIAANSSSPHTPPNAWTVATVSECQLRRKPPLGWLPLSVASSMSGAGRAAALGAACERLPLDERTVWNAQLAMLPRGRPRQDYAAVIFAGLAQACDREHAVARVLELEAEDALAMPDAEEVEALAADAAEVAATRTLQCAGAWARLQNYLRAHDA